MSLTNRVHPIRQREYGCCSRGEDATRKLELQRIACASEAEAQALEAQFWQVTAARPRRLAVFVNPAGGTGRAKSIYAEQARARCAARTTMLTLTCAVVSSCQVEPLLAIARVRATVVHTEHRGHAAEVAAGLDVQDFDAVMVVSGDGLLSEVYNGLMANARQPAASMLPLAIIPAGSGNAMAKSLAARVRERCTPVNAALAALCCQSPMPLDAATLTQPGLERPMHALLSLSWALVADVDIESEALRFLGAARFTVQAVVRCLALRRYAGTFLFTQPAGSAPVGRAAHDAELALVARAGAGRVVDDDAPTADAWRALDGPFDSLWALNVPWGGEEALAAPGAVPDDGCFDVILIRGGSPVAVAAALIAFEDGTHVSHDCVTVVKARAFVLDPGKPTGGGDAGVLVLDGEKVATAERAAHDSLPLQYGPLSVRVRQAAARLLARPATDADI